MTPHYINSWQKHTPGNLETNTCTAPPHLILCIIIFTKKKLKHIE